MPNSQKDKAEAFRALHDADDLFVMPNAWDGGSARLLAAGGFPALATTSAGIAFALGRPDSQSRLSRDEMLAACRRIAAVVDLPVSGDLENGYGHDPDAAAETIRRSAEVGLVGGSIEDYTGDLAAPLYELPLAVERIAAAVEAARATGLAYTLTARAECYLVGHPDPFAESLKRVQAYGEAGADCLYVPGIRDLDQIRTLVREAGRPVNILVGIKNWPHSLEVLGEAGVRRISIGGSLARASYGQVLAAAREMAGPGPYDFPTSATPEDQLTAVFTPKSADES